jgi:hypothetical protein
MQDLLREQGERRAENLDERIVIIIMYTTVNPSLLLFRLFFFRRDLLLGIRGIW